MDEDRKALSLININGGAAVEMFDRALKKVFENINDINTTLKQREVNLKMVFAPSDDRTLVTIQMECTPKLCGQEPQKITADLTLDQRGRAIAFERQSPQLGLFPTNVSSMQKQGGDSND